ncbi:MAG: penicillin acylase family protein [Solirubrobacteraceae bacterium]|nr:penicillin acylase family protein [Solirubrobacteraceae bacterium]
MSQLRRVLGLGVLAGALGAIAPAAQAADVTVTRTVFGVPHIKAESFRGIGYGYGRSVAEDNICTLAEMYVTVNGERSKFFGPDASYSVGGNGTAPNNLNSDFYFQRVKDRKTVEKLIAVPPPVGPREEVADGLQGYVDGYNDWLASVGGSAGVPDPTCRGKAWVRPITVLDAYRRVHQLSILASEGAAIDGIGGAQPPGAKSTTGASAADRVSALPPQALDEALSGLGSNAYALGRDATQDGHGLLYGNPHFPWTGSERFYQSHITIPGVVDVTGGSLLGVPIVLIGATKGVAWSHTVSTARRFVPYEVALLPGQPEWYWNSGKFQRMKRENVTVQVRTASGALESRTRTLYSTKHGSITTSITGLKIFPWTPLTAVALYDGNGENFGRMINTFFGMNEAQSVADVDRNLRKFTGMPWVNTIAADTAGNAYYADIGNVPGVSNQKYNACLGLLGRITDAAQRLPVFDGSKDSCLPSSDADSVVPGILGPSKLPSLQRTDWVANMNDSYWLSNPAKPLEGYPRIVGDERKARTLRTRIGIKQVQDRLAGTDGLAGKGFNLDNVRDVAMGNRVYSAELWRDALVKGCSRASCKVLAKWNLRNDLDEPGAVLWQRFATRLVSFSPIPLPTPLSPYTKGFDVKDPVNTPSGLLQASPIVVGALNDAEADMKKAGLPLDATLRTAQTVTRQGQVIPIHGGPHSTGIFNVFTPVWDAAKGYTDIVSGGSYIQAVHLKPGCPELRTIVTYGQSTNPESPYYADQTKLLSNKQWNTLPFCGDDVAAQAIKTDNWGVPGT